MTVLPQSPGVYLIANRVTGRVYVGSSRNMRRRQCEHLSALRYGRARGNLALIESHRRRLAVKS